jgi:predicted RNase H-like nuclease (RuvC/YqgF family)
MEDGDPTPRGASRRLRARSSIKWAKDDSLYLSSPEMSDDTEGRRPLKRKVEEVDLETIKDPVKRRLEKQKAKNRRTAAKSRERKKEQQAWLETENDRLHNAVEELRERLAQRSREIEELAQAQGLAYTAAGGTTNAVFLMQLLAGSSAPAT